MNEAAKIAEQQNDTEVLTAFTMIPYALINSESNNNGKDILDELTDICKFYKIYKKGIKFNPEGMHGDYIPSDLRYKMSASLVDKEARFLFGETPDIVIDPKGDASLVTKEIKTALTNINDTVKSILKENMFEDGLIKAAKDCFIGKRVACVVNFNEEDGVTLSFLPSTQFIYETKIGNANVLTKFVCFMIVNDSVTLKDKRIFKKKYVLENDGYVYVEEKLYDGAGNELELITNYQQTKLKEIPAVIILNDGLTGETKGESEIDILKDYELWYSKLCNADIDAERKNMNPIKYTVDMAQDSTKNLPAGAGAKWDLGTDQNLPNANPMVGILESGMNYSDSLKVSLDRIKTTGYEQLDMPNITLESLQGAITSGKSLKAIYWPLITRCKEKMKAWGPKLCAIIDIMIKGCFEYPNCIKKYCEQPLVPIAYEIHVRQNLPLPEDEQEEKNMDLSEVESKVMSRKSYMKKWRDLTDDEVEEELRQIALERQLLEDSAILPDNEQNSDMEQNNEQNEVF